MSEISTTPNGDHSRSRIFASPQKRYLTATSHSGLRVVWDGGMPVLPPDGARPVYNVAKRIADLALALVALALLGPLLLVLALAIRMSSDGPIFFRQIRVGHRGRHFQVLKFRTMRCEDGDYSGVRQTTEGDLRLTPIGAWLRRTSLDELPQLLNILVGEMSFCGPRPHVPGQLAAGRPYEELVPYYAMRHSVVPGLTGWAQANGFRGPTVDAARARARVDHDIAYIQNASLWLDLIIILMTAKQEFLNGHGS